MEELIPAGQDRWLLSYSDLVTLLFALFVVLFASSRSQSQHIPSPPRVQPAPRQEELAPLQEKLSRSLAADRTSGKIEIAVESRGLVLELRDASFFASGDDQIRPDAYSTINDIAREIGSIPNLVSIEGHSDAVAIHGTRFRDNWELSAARGVSVIRYLTQTLGLTANRFSAAAYADTRPRSDNTSETGRAQNRRVDIVIHRRSDEGK